MDLSNGFGFESPDFYDPVQGGPIDYTVETQLDPVPVLSTLDPLPCISSGPLQPGQSHCAQDGSSGDSTALNSSALWGTIAGIGGSFLKAFTGGQGIQIGGTTGSKPATSTPTQTQAAAAAAAKSQQIAVMVMAGVGAVVLVVLLTRK